MRGGFVVKMTFTKSAFEMPDGKYLAKFTGVTMRDATGQLDQKGQPMPPGMTWDFVIVEGDQAGKKADKLTGRQPTPKSACGKFLAAVSDTILKDGQEVDLGQFVGALYRITVMDNRISDNPTPVRVYDRAAGGPPPTPVAQQATLNTPPKLEVKVDDDWDTFDQVGIQKAIAEGIFDVATSVARVPGTKDKKTLKEWGFSDKNAPIPF